MTWRFKHCTRPPDVRWVLSAALRCSEGRKISIAMRLNLPKERSLSVLVMGQESEKAALTTLYVLQAACSLGVLVMLMPPNPALQSVAERTRAHEQK